MQIIQIIISSLNLLGKLITRDCPGMVRKDMKKHGPVTAIMRVYEDFVTYKSGI